MYFTTSQLLNLGVSPSEIEAKLTSGEWQPGELSSHGGAEEKTILVATLPCELQVRWMRAHVLSPSSDRIAALLSEAAGRGWEGWENEVAKLLLSLPQGERFA